MTDSGFTVDVDQNQYLPEGGREVSAEPAGDHVSVRGGQGVGLGQRARRDHLLGH